MNIPKSRQRQAGTAAIEFALIFPLLFAITYAGVVYGYVFFTQQSINYMAQQAVRSALQVNPSRSDYDTLIASTAAASVAYNASNFPNTKLKGAFTQATTIERDSAGNPTVLVTVTLPGSALQAAGFASFPLPGRLGTFPPLPPRLTATAASTLR